MIFVPDFLTIPDGLRSAAGAEGQRRVRISARTTPRPLRQPIDGSSGLKLEAWPSEVAKFGERTLVHFGTIRDGQINIDAEATIEAASMLTPYFRCNGGSELNKIDAVWQRLFASQFGHLTEALLRDYERQAAGPTPRFISTRSSDLNLFLAALDGASTGKQGVGRNEVGPAVRSRIERWLEEGRGTRSASAGWQKTFEQRAEDFRAMEAVAAGQRAGHAKGPASGAWVTVFEETFRDLGECLRPNDTDADTSLLETSEEEELSAARRKFVSLLSLSGIAPLFGLGVELEVPVDRIPKGPERAFAVSFAGCPDLPRVWTAYDLDADENYFGPTPDPDYNDKIYPFRKGFVALRSKLAGPDSGDRYSLQSRNTVNETLQFLVQAEGGERRRNRAGIVLIDNASTARQQLEEDRDRKRSEMETKIMYADDLIVGIRPDVGVSASHDRMAIDPDRWFSLTDRVIRWLDDDAPSACEGDETFSDLMRDIRHRDHGFAAVIEQEKSSALIQVEDELFDWSGESLAIMPAKRLADTELDPNADPAIRLSYDLPFPGEVAGSRGLPPLREGWPYGVAARYVYANGSGPQLNDATTARYATEPELALGVRCEDGAGEPDLPLSYPTKAPLYPGVHLPSDDPLLTAEEPSQTLRGDAVSSMVVRRGRTVSRIVTPSQEGFDQAERQGQFDRTRNPSASGTLKRDGGVAVFGERASFPEARFIEGEAALYDLQRREDERFVLRKIPIDGGPVGPDVLLEAHTPGSRGSVAVLGHFDLPAEAPAQGEFYASLRSAAVRIEIKRKDRAGNWKLVSEADLSRSFWTADEGVTEARPLLVRALAAEAGNGFSVDEKTEAWAPTVDGSLMRLPFLGVRLLKGATCRVCLTPAPEDHTAFDEPLPTDDAPVIQMTRPIRRPASKPKVLNAEGVLTLNAITVRVSDDDNARSDTAPTWAELAKARSAVNEDPLTWESDPEGTKTFFLGHINIDRLTTRSLQCTAEWEEWDETSLRRLENGQWSRVPSVQRAVVFSEPVERLDTDQFDLLGYGELEGGIPKHVRGLSHTFKDGRARALNVRVGAVSAFREFYAESEPQSAFTRFSSKLPEGKRLVTNSTIKPPQPVIDRALPTFTWQKGDGWMKRNSGIRIRVGEGWYATGVDEDLAIILNSEGREASGSYADYISRVAHDPGRDSGPLPQELGPENFPGMEVIEVRQENGPIRLLVGALKFHPEEGLFMDIPISLGSNYAPFLKLGLVRRQRHGAPGTAYSDPISYDARLLPWRKVELVSGGGGFRRRLTVRGPRFLPPTSVTPTQPLFRPSMFRVRFFYWSEAFATWLEIENTQLDFDMVQGPNDILLDETVTLPRPTEGGGNNWPTKVVVEEFERVPTEKPKPELSDGLVAFEEAEDEQIVFSCWLDTNR